MIKRSIRIHAEKTGNNAYLSLIPLLSVSFLLRFFVFFSVCDFNAVLIFLLGKSIFIVHYISI